MQRRVTGTLRVILVCDRRAEESHDAVAGVLIDRAFEPVNAVGEDREEAIHDFVPFLGIDLLRQVHRSLHISKEHRDLLPLAFESGTSGEDLLGEVFRRVGAGVGGAACRCASDRGRTLVAELGYGAKLRTAACTLASERSRTFFAELGAISVLMAAPGALHPASSFATCSARIGAPISRNSRCASRSSPWQAASLPFNRASSARSTRRKGS
jgi:hypothetical protein